MDRNGFDQRATGTLTPTIGARKAFVPHPLPPATLDLHRILPELKGTGRLVPNPPLLIRPLHRREQVSSSSPKTRKLRK